MPRIRPPAKLVDLGKSELKPLMIQMVTSLIDQLILDEEYEKLFWDEELTKTYDDIRSIPEYLMACPMNVLKDCVEDVLPNYLKQIQTYLLHPLSLMNYNSAAIIRRGICKEILCSVFLPCIETCNLEVVTSLSFLRIVYKSIFVMNRLKTLILPNLSTHLLHSSLVVQIASFSLLEKFEYMEKCTDAIIYSLGIYCRNLKILIVSGSVEVTDISVTRIVGMSNLTMLDIRGTRISPRGYSNILSKGPKIQNLTEYHLLDFVLSLIPNNVLNNVTQFHGWVSNPGILSLKCRYLKKICMLNNHQDIRCLANLRNLEDLSIHWSDSLICRLDELFKVIGAKRLKKLSLQHVQYIELYSILSKLRSVEILEILHCNFLPLSPNVRPRLTSHFSTIKVMSVSSQSVDFISSNLTNYANLQELYLTDSLHLSDEFIHSTLDARGLLGLTKFHIARSSELTLAAVTRLIDTCDYLMEIGDLEFWDNVQYEGVRILWDIVREMNYDLEIIYSNVQ